MQNSDCGCLARVFNMWEDRAGILIQKDAFFECKEVVWGVVGMIKVSVRSLGPCDFFSLACSSRMSVLWP